MKIPNEIKCKDKLNRAKKQLQLKTNKVLKDKRFYVKFNLPSSVQLQHSRNINSQTIIEMHKKISNYA